MKSTLLLLLMFCLSFTAFGQQSPKADDALLLEYFQNQRFAEAADYLKKAYPEPISDVKILSSLAYASQMAGKLPDAEDYYQRIFVADTSNTAILFNLGGINARRGNNAKAIGFYKRILLRDSLNFNVLKQMASLSQSMGNLQGSVVYLKKANKINPAEPDVAYDLATFYIREKSYLPADTVVNSALKADTANLLLLLGKAQIVYSLKKYPETVAVCTQLIQAGSQTSTVINMLGNSYYVLKKYSDCINTLKLLEESQSASETSYYYTAMSYKELHNNAMAVAYFEKAIKESLSSNVNSYYGEMAGAYDDMHQYKNAVSAYQKSLIYGVMPLTYYALANMYDTELKNKALAFRYYKKYLASNPQEDQQSYIDYAKRRVGELGR